jgi:hypothetical protein
MANDYWTEKVRSMTLPEQRSRLAELSRKIRRMVVLAKDELSELIALRKSLQEQAAKYGTSRSQKKPPKRRAS